MPFPDLTCTTEIEAVNILLSTIGESPVNTIDATPQTVDVAIAIDTIRAVSRDVQTKGWYFNTDTNFSLAVNGSGEIALPDNAAKVVVDRCNANIDPVVRGQKLYDRKNQTYHFTNAVTAKRIVYLLPFTELPQSARTYITIRAAREFADRQMGAESIHAYNQQRELDAWRLLLGDEAETENYNVLRNVSVWPTVLR